MLFMVKTKISRDNRPKLPAQILHCVLFTSPEVSMVDGVFPAFHSYRAIRCIYFVYKCATSL